MSLDKIEKFIKNDDDFLILKGAAGTGKTSILKAVVDYCESTNQAFELLAPTNCAAKVISNKTKKTASTICSHIYIPQLNTETGILSFRPKINEEECLKIYIVDESSMISDKEELYASDFITEKPLLRAFLNFIKQGNNQNKVIFVGDNCQLPPIGYGPNELSPALCTNYLSQKYNLKGTETELETILRQQSGSYILENAHDLRKTIKGINMPRYTEKIGQHIWNKDGVIAAYLKHYEDTNFNSAAVLSLSNKYVNEANAAIRNQLGFSNTIAKGDKVVFNQNFANNHTFVNNGEMAEITEIGNIKLVSDMKFMNIGLRFKASNGEFVTVNGLTNIDYLQNPESITSERKIQLYANANKKNEAYRKTKNVRDDEFLSAMCLGYGHAVNFHKAQGSEWDTIIMNTWVPKVNPDYRILYTGITRARKHLFSNNAHTYNN